jgi:hypothetical protein
MRYASGTLRDRNAFYLPKVTEKHNFNSFPRGKINSLG